MILPCSLFQVCWLRVNLKDVEGNSDDEKQDSEFNSLLYLSFLVEEKTGKVQESVWIWKDLREQSGPPVHAFLKTVDPSPPHPAEGWGGGG